MSLNNILKSNVKNTCARTPLRCGASLQCENNVIKTLLAGLILLSLAFTTGISAQARRGKPPATGEVLTPKESSPGIVGLRGGYFFPAGDLGNSLSGGFAAGLYFNVKPNVFLGGTGSAAENEKLPWYIPSAQAMVNFEGLSGEGTSLNRIGLEIGPSWSFGLTQAGNQFISLSLLAGASFETGKNENFSPALEKSGLQFNAVFLLNYEFHHLSTGLIYSVGSYNVIGADKKTPLIGVGFNAGVGYKI